MYIYIFWSSTDIVHIIEKSSGYSVIFVFCVPLRKFNTKMLTCWFQGFHVLRQTAFFMLLFLVCSQRLHLFNQRCCKISVKYYYILKQVSILKYFLLNFNFVMQSWIFSIITPIFSVTWSFRNHSNMLIWKISLFCLFLSFSLLPLLIDEMHLCWIKVQKCQ